MPKTKSRGRPSEVRIIAGTLRGRKVMFQESHPMYALRPTSDRIRETLFNWLSPVIFNTECLDAFAGSGALSFEAISRGAKQVTLIEKCSQTIKHIQENAERFKIAPTQFNVLCRDTLDYLAETNQIFDIIFLDPPFQQSLLNPCIQLITSRGLIRSGGYVYTESAEPLSLENFPQCWGQTHAKKAGSVYYGLLQKQ